MKLVLSTRRFGPPFMGGVDVYAQRLGRSLSRLGHQLSYIAFNTTEEGESAQIELQRDRHEQNSVWRFRFAVQKRPVESFALAYDPEIGDHIRRILVEEKPDLFIVMNFYLLTFAAVEAAAELGIPVVHLVTDFVPVCRRATLIQWDGQSCQTGESVKSCSRCFVSHRRAGRLAARLFDQLSEESVRELAGQSGLLNPLRLFPPYLRQARLMARRLELLLPLRHQISLVLAPTRYTADAFVANGFRPDQVQLLPFAVDPDHPLAGVEHQLAEQTRFLFVGRIEPYKGLHLVIEAFNNLAAPAGATLTIYGAAGGYQDYFSRLEQAAAVNPNIHFAGTVPQSELGNVFSQADYFILSSTWHENSPLILLDALQSKTPVIASDIGGVRDIIKHGVNGLLFPMGDSKSLQSLMQEVINRPELAASLRAGIDLPTIDSYARQMLALCRPFLKQVT